jgi:hypothetical protein
MLPPYHSDNLSEVGIHAGECAKELGLRACSVVLRRQMQVGKVGNSEAVHYTSITLPEKSSLARLIGLNERFKPG